LWQFPLISNKPWLVMYPTNRETKPVSVIHMVILGCHDLQASTSPVESVSAHAPGDSKAASATVIAESAGTPDAKAGKQPSSTPTTPSNVSRPGKQSGSSATSGAGHREAITTPPVPPENINSEAVVEDSTAPAAEAEAEQSPDSRTMPYTRMLLYLCADRELPVAMRKAFSVIAKDPSPRVKLQAPDICRILYPNGLTCKQIFKVPVEEDEVAEIIARMRGMHVDKEAEPEQPTKEKGGGKGKAAPKDKAGPKDKGGKKGEKVEEVKEKPKPEVEAVPQVTSDQFAYHHRGAALLQACGSRYKLRDLLLDMRRIKPSFDEENL
jgi:hypothetical protein